MGKCIFSLSHTVSAESSVAKSDSLASLTWQGHGPMLHVPGEAPVEVMEDIIRLKASTLLPLLLAAYLLAMALATLSSVPKGSS